MLKNYLFLECCCLSVPEGSGETGRIKKTTHAEVYRVHPQGACGVMGSLLFW